MSKREDANTEEGSSHLSNRHDGPSATQSPSFASETNRPIGAAERVPGSFETLTAVNDGPDALPLRNANRDPRDMEAADGLGDGDEARDFPGLPAAIVAEEDDAHWEREDWNGVLEGQL